MKKKEHKGPQETKPLVPEQLQQDSSFMSDFFRFLGKGFSEMDKGVQ